MKWRRGILFALIHAVIVLTVIVKTESREWPRASAETDASGLQRIAWQESQTIAFDPCDGGFVDGTWPAEDVIAFANFPAMAITGWPSACPQRTIVARFAKRALHTRGRATESAVHVIVVIVIAVEWLLIGGFPFVRRRHWWSEPAAFITICTVIGFTLAMVSPLTHLARVACLGAFVGWLWWFGALLLKGVRAIWAHRLARA